MVLPKTVTRDHEGREVIRDKLRIGSPLNVSILIREHLSRTRSYESITGQMSLHKGNTWLEAERSKCLHMAE